MIRESGLSSRQAREALYQAKDVFDLAEKEVNEILNH